MSEILLNRIKTPDGTILISRSRHDFQTYVDKNGLEYMVDGGLDYLRRNVVAEAPYQELSVHTDDNLLKKSLSVEWGTYGKDGKQPLKYVRIRDMTTNHIKAVLAMAYLSPKFAELFKEELAFRESLYE